jgi:cytoskeletal protein RodZ
VTATMSTVHPDDFDDSGETGAAGAFAAPATVVVRRNAGLSALIGAGASAVAIAYLWRATQSSAPLDWALCVVMAAIAACYLAQLVDARTPLLVADDLGVRIRLGNQWRGLPWDAVGEVVVHERRGLLRDGRLVFGPHSEVDPFEGLESRGRRAAALNRRWYGAALAVPLGLTTRVSARGAHVADGLAALARGRAEVMVAEPADAQPHVDHDADPLAGDDVGENEPAAHDLEGTHPTGADLAGSDRHEPAAAGLLGFEAYDDARRDDAGFRLGWTEDPTDLAGEQAEAGHAGTYADPAEADAEAEGEADADFGPTERTEPTGLEARARRSRLGDLGVIVSRFTKGGARHSRRPDPDEAPGHGNEPLQDPEDRRPHEDHGDPEDREDDEPTVRLQGAGPAARSAVPLLRDTRRALRAEVVRDTPATVLGNAALLPDADPSARSSTLPEHEQLRRQGEPGGEIPRQATSEDRLDRARVHRISAADPVEPLLLDDLTRPAPHPVIGPELAAARTRVGLSVDELAERTRIRPHVIESIEVDDFAPCGGDFYARGHLRTLARLLGRDAAPLIAEFDSRYATAPINARKVFEAELATGMTAGTRRSLGGPSWAMLVAAVLVLGITWAAVRLFASEPPEVLQSPAPLPDAAAAQPATGSQPATSPTATPVQVRVVASQAGSRVLIRDRTGEVVWAGDLLLGEQRTVRAVPPVRVQAEDAGAVEVTVNGQDRGAVGALGQPGHRTFVRPGAR